ncbi:exocyst complex component EXO70A1 [Prunus yedoensis var. nudiflora]|uniref:Exocyst complex component EXO70A1 n=1 Tax=Prunus yedoensis var. nudiflora TaxID=2094558 RepID=A0A314ZC58_PRUYE|nr:exocyst complex component EXO70A1 [Prunus yedoensis var. nudiflora]
MKRLEGALRFLADKCEVATQWLQDIVEFLEGKTFANDRSLLSVKKALRIIQELHAIEGFARRDGGLLNDAFNELEAEFISSLMENSTTTITSIASSPLISACNSKASSHS